MISSFSIPAAERCLTILPTVGPEVCPLPASINTVCSPFLTRRTFPSNTNLWGRWSRPSKNSMISSGSLSGAKSGCMGSRSNSPSLITISSNEPNVNLKKSLASIFSIVSIFPFF
ncbi:hypothetical protein ACFP3I_12095 [Chryseobacterium arachidis]|uniref:hypothetical protein n=1 Tax=Chryseobacterium arachidis TaxID=1416778 RepID=UPI00361EA25D